MQLPSNNSIFFGKKILLGVTGSIAAYKTPELVRLFVKSGAEVKVILTKSATSFVTALSLSTVSCNDVLMEFVDRSTNKWHNHVDLALWADVFLIAPATANTIAKMATGLCDNILLATFLSSKCTVFCAPAMDRDMYLSKSNSNNLKIIQKRGVKILDVESGELASGLHGLGRMQDINTIFSKIEHFFLDSAPLFGTKVLITAGPTYERIDPVRFIGNFSSGKMGVALAEEAASNGAIVDLVIGPSTQNVSHPSINRIDVETADQMFTICDEKFDHIDIAIFSAAVSDFKPTSFRENKIKDKTLTIETKRNKDIIQILAKKKKKQFVVGFALETENGESSAIKKIKSKNMDLIILNSLQDDGAGFKHDTNKAKIIDNDLNIKNYPLMTKQALASIIFKEILLKKNILKSFKDLLK